MQCCVYDLYIVSVHTDCHDPEPGEPPCRAHLDRVAQPPRLPLPSPLRSPRKPAFCAQSCAATCVPRRAASSRRRPRRPCRASPSFCAADGSPARMLAWSALRCPRCSSGSLFLDEPEIVVRRRRARRLGARPSTPRSAAALAGRAARSAGCGLKPWPACRTSSAARARTFWFAARFLARRPTPCRRRPVRVRARRRRPGRRAAANA